MALRPTRLLPPKRLLTPRSARRLSTTDRGLLPGSPAITRVGLSPTGLVQLRGRTMGRAYALTHRSTDPLTATHQDREGPRPPPRRRPSSILSHGRNLDCTLWRREPPRSAWIATPAIPRSSPNRGLPHHRFCRLEWARGRRPAGPGRPKPELATRSITLRADLAQVKTSRPISVPPPFRRARRRLRRPGGSGSGPDRPIDCCTPGSWRQMRHLPSPKIRNNLPVAPMERP